MSPARKSLFNLALSLSILLIILAVEGQSYPSPIGKPTPSCKKVFGVRSGDTCFEITQLFNLTTNFFELINPNLVCTKMFVGEWVCVDGTLK